jgi:hypothetical protein
MFALKIMKPIIKPDIIIASIGISLIFALAGDLTLYAVLPVVAATEGIHLVYFLAPTGLSDLSATRWLVFSSIRAAGKIFWWGDYCWEQRPHFYINITIISGYS